MKLLRTKRFVRDYGGLPKTVQRQTDRKLRYLAENIAHPSLRVKYLRGSQHAYEGSINMQYRFLFEITINSYRLMRVGKHDILDKL